MKGMSRRRIRTLVVAAGAMAMALLGAVPGAAAEKVHCTGAPFEAQVVESRLDDEQTPATMLARVRGMTTFTCSDGTEIPVGLEQGFALQFGNGQGDVCFRPDTVEQSRFGQVRGRTQATLSVQRPDGTVRSHDLRGIVKGTIEVNDTDATQCLLELDATAHAANAQMSIRFSGEIDRTTGVAQDLGADIADVYYTTTGRASDDAIDGAG